MILRQKIMDDTPVEEVFSAVGFPWIWRCSSRCLNVGDMRAVKVLQEPGPDQHILDKIWGVLGH